MTFLTQWGDLVFPEIFLALLQPPLGIPGLSPWSWLVGVLGRLCVPVHREATGQQP